MAECRQCGATVSEDAQVCSDCGTEVPSAGTDSPAHPEPDWAVVNGPAWLLARQRSLLGRKEAQADGEVEGPGPGLGARIVARIIMVIVLVALAVLMVLVILLLKAFV